MAKSRAGAQRQAREGEMGDSAQLSLILDQLPDGILAVNEEGIVTLCNAVFRRWLGRDLTGDSLTDLLQTYHLEKPNGERFGEGETPIERALLGEVVASVEVDVALAGGYRIALLENASPLAEVDGFRGAVVAATNITSLKGALAEGERLLDEVQRARESLSTIIDHLPEWVLVVDRSMRVQVTNQAVRQFLGHEGKGRLLPEIWREYGALTGSNRPFLPGATPFHYALEGRAVTGIEARARREDGSTIHLLVNAVPLRGPDGDVESVVITVTDITVQKEAQGERERLLAEVQRGREDLRTIINHLPDGVVVVDPAGRITLHNETVREYLGKPVTGARVDVLCRELGLMTTGNQPFPEGETPFEVALRGEPVIGLEALARPPAGPQIDLLISAAPLWDSDGRVREVAVVLTDVTPLKDLDRAKDRFFSVAAHELRTPLTSLRGHAQMLLRRAERAGWKADDLRSLRTIDEQVDRLNDLIDRLLDVSRIRQGRLQINRQPMDLVALVRRVAADMQVTTQAHEITVEAQQPDITGLWDPSALQQVLTNLINNAIKYVPGGRIEVCVRREGDQAMVSVIDHGPGIPPEKQARLFQAFTRGSALEYREGGGLGLGLFIAHAIVQAHDGHIWVESQVGVGSTFSFALPVGDLPKESVGWAGQRPQPTEP